MIKISKIKFLPILYLVVLLVEISRGIGEIIFDKRISYFFQAIFLIIFFIANLKFLIKLKPIDKIYLYLVLFFSGSSLCISIIYDALPASVIFLVFFINVINIMFLIVSISILYNINLISYYFAEFSSIYILRIISIFIIILSFASVFGFIDFPGTASYGDFLRISGSLGSKQHLSIILSLLFLMNLEISFKLMKVLDIIITFVLLTLLLITFTRIGYLIVAISVFLFYVNSFLFNKKIAHLKFILVFFLILFILFFLFYHYNSIYINTIIDRILDININEYSNKLRLQSFEAGIKLYFSGLIFISNQTGMASQLPGVLYGLNINHYENGQLQYLINFGLFFTILVMIFYARWAYFLRKINSFNSFTPVAMWFALFSYMFNEIIPIYVFYPFISIVATKFNKDIS